MSNSDNSPSENETPPKPAAKPEQISRTGPENLPAQTNSLNSIKAKGVTGLLREIFRRNASQSNIEEGDAPLPESYLDRIRSQPPDMDQPGEQGFRPSELEAFNALLLSTDSSSQPVQPETPASGGPNLLTEGYSGNPLKPPTPNTALHDETSIPNKGGFKSLFTGALRNTGAQEPKIDRKQEEAIDDRLSSIFASEPEKPAELSWEDQFLASLGPSTEQNQDLIDAGNNYYDPASNFLSEIKAKDNNEVDYLFQEWVGYNKSKKDEPDPPHQKPIFSSELDEPEPFKQLPSKSIFEDEDEAIFEENHQEFRAKNSFLYTPNKNQEPVSLEEMRQVVLENIQNDHADAKQRKKRSSVDMSSRSFRNFSRVEIFAMIFLGILTIAAAIAIPLVLSRSSPQAAPAPSTPTVILHDIAPAPVGIQITGGWYFALTKNTIVDGRWKPKGPEWLEGSDIRRVVTLPWNKQLEAAIKTLLKGDEIVLSFNNNDQITFLVDKIAQVAADQTNIGDQTVSSLLIILYDENSPNRWVVTCFPKTN